MWNPGLAVPGHGTGGFCPSLYLDHGNWLSTYFSPLALRYTLRFIFLKQPCHWPARLFAQETSALSTNSQSCSVGTASFQPGPGSLLHPASCPHPVMPCVNSSLVFVLNCLSLCVLPQFGMSSIFKIPPSIPGSCYIPTTSPNLFRLLQHTLVSLSFYFFSNIESALLFLIALNRYWAPYR